MPRQQTAHAFHLPAGDAAAADEIVDYDADYRALDLEPGAPPRDIADRAQLLREAFDADKVPRGLRAPALARAQIVERAAASLAQYWRAHGAPPPRTPGGATIALSERFLAALAEALGTGEAAEAAPPAAREPPPSPAAVVRVAAPVPVRGSPPERQLPAVIASVRKTASPIDVAVQPAVGAPRDAAPGRRPGSALRSVLVKLVLFGMVATAAIRVLQYRAEHPELAALGGPAPALSAGPQGEPPVRWSGLAAPQQPTGAAAPAVGGRVR